jgi:hypothetical protein
MSAVELWSIVASIVSVILGFFAIFLSVYFFVQSRTTEKGVSNSLVKIETQAESLQKLTSRYLDRLTRYVTEEKSQAMNDSVPALVAILAQLPQTITTTLLQITPRDKTDELTTEIYSCYITLYFYIAQTNYWSQFYLPTAAEFDEENRFHTLVRRIVDMSAADFEVIANILSKCEQPRLQTNKLVHLLNEMKEFWRTHVKTTAQVFIRQESNS